MTRDEWKAKIAKSIGTLPSVVEKDLRYVLNALETYESQRIAAVTEWAETFAEFEAEWHRAEMWEERATQKGHEIEALRREIAFLKLGALLQSTMTKESK